MKDVQIMPRKVYRDLEKALNRKAADDLGISVEELQNNECKVK